MDILTFDWRCGDTHVLDDSMRQAVHVVEALLGTGDEGDVWSRRFFSFAEAK